MMMTKILDMIRRCNKVLLQLIIGILLYGILIQIVGLFLVKDKIFFSYSLWVGIIMAIAMAIHMQFSIEKAVNQEGRAAQTVLSRAYLIRTVVIFLIMGTGAYFEFLSIIPCFIGLMGLKAAAILQPKMDKLWRKNMKEGGAEAC